MLIIVEVKNIKYFLGNELINLGKQEEAIKDFTKAIEIDP